jgi:hypothetical protein
LLPQYYHILHSKLQGKGPLTSRLSGRTPFFSQSSLPLHQAEMKPGS